MRPNQHYKHLLGHNKNTLTASEQVVGISADDISWSENLGLFCAVGSSGIYTSPDGDNWTLRGFSGNGVCWSNAINKFVVVDAGSYPSTNKVYTSSDGISWATASTVPYPWFDWNCVSSSGSTLVALSTNGTYPAMYSYDGDTWMTATISSGVGGFQDVDHNGTHFVAVSNTSYSRIYFSSDGATWDYRTPPTNVQRYDVSWFSSLSKWFTFGTIWSGSRINSSTDASVSWSTVTEPSGMFDALCGAASDQYVIAIGYQGKWMYSSDGVNWTVKSDISSSYWNAVCWSPTLSKFVAVTGGRILTISFT